MRRTALIPVSLFLVACVADPTAPPPSSMAARLLTPAAGAFSITLSASKKTTISGTIGFVGTLAPARFLSTPSGRCHFWDFPEITEFTGDVSGAVTFDEHVNAPCDLSDLGASAPFSGQVTWNGRTGGISGQWTTNCIADPSQPVALSCDGTMNARGSGGLDGVHFHFTWGPGWFPFPYTGTAFSD
jgi:hypothetical protein